MLAPMACRSPTLDMVRVFQSRLSDRCLLTVAYLYTLYENIQVYSSSFSQFQHTLEVPKP